MEKKSYSANRPNNISTVASLPCHDDADISDPVPSPTPDHVPIAAHHLQTTCEVGRQLLEDTVRCASSRFPPAPPGGDSAVYVITMRSLVCELTTRHKEVFRTTAALGVDSFEPVMDELLADGRINWGRVVTLFAVIDQIARDSRHIPATRARLVRTADDYMKRHLAAWVANSGGWSSFHTYFRAQQKIGWSGLFVTALGLGVLATLLIVH